MSQVDEIKATIEDKVEEIKSKVADATTRMELKKRIVDNPWALVGFGALAGVWLASHGTGRANKKAGAVVGVLGALTLRVIRDASMYQMTKIAKGWLAAPSTPTPYAH